MLNGYELEAGKFPYHLGRLRIERIEMLTLMHQPNEKSTACEFSGLGMMCLPVEMDRNGATHSYLTERWGGRNNCEVCIG